MKILVSGASFAGLSTAYWMRQMGHDVTIVEIGSALRTGGTAVNIREGTIEVVKRMGILDAIRADRLSLERWDLLGPDGVAERTLALRSPGDPPSEEEIEVERNVLLNLLFGLVRDVEIVFGETITSMHETREGVHVTFAKGSPRSFDLVFGCDGIHSTVRKLWFGHEAEYVHFLEQYFSITIVDELLIERNTAQMFNTPGKLIMLNAYKDKTDIIFAFVSEKEIPYDHRDEARQRQIIIEKFAGHGWRAAELLEKVDASPSFYFDKLCQIRMPSWAKGRVALVGDAGYCPSPAAGMGGSIAIDGAAALADAMRESDGDFERAFRGYESRFRPFVERVQAEAARTGLETLVPRTEEAIRRRNTESGFQF